VTDFISVGTFAVFNVADASISVGTAVLILAVWISERKQKKLENANLEGVATPLDSPSSYNQMDWSPDAPNQMAEQPGFPNQEANPPDVEKPRLE